MNAEDHLKYRLEYPKHRNATWYVGTLGGQVVVGLGCYQFDFRVRGEVIPGFAFGEVHTRAEYRGRGYAPKLLDSVEQHQKAQGRVLGMLYSDINPEYYHRLGYELCPSNEGWADPISTTAYTSPHELIPFERQGEATNMAGIYAAYHAGRAISVERSTEYWNYLLSRNPKDEFYWIENSADERVGYVRVSTGEKTLLLRDLALVSDDSALRRDALAAIIQLGAARSASRVGGWMADTPLHRELFAVESRRRELTMLKSLRPDLLLTADIIAAVDHFQEIDHV